MGDVVLIGTFAHRYVLHECFYSMCTCVSHIKDQISVMNNRMFLFVN